MKDVQADTKDWTHVSERFFSLVGYCITEWARVDDELFRIFQHCVGNPKQCAIIFYRTPGIDIRIALTDEIVRSVLPLKDRKSGGHDHPSVKAWSEAIRGYKPLLSVRRRIAHQPADFRIPGLIEGQDLDDNAVPIFEIYTGKNERLRKNDDQPLKHAELFKHFMETKRFARRLAEFYHHTLIKRPTEFPPP